MIDSTHQNMTPFERRAALSMASIYAVRMLGLFMILPVFSLYASGMEAVTPLLIGIAIGIYGMTQAIFQIPLGMLSDHFGRKPIIVAGLLIFALGSGVAALSDSIYGIIFGRALQGAGAVAAAVMALAADLTREEHRTKVMATIGASIGVAFALSMILGPILNNHIGVPGIFGLTSVLALIAIGIVLFAVPTVAIHFHRDTEVVPATLRTVLRDTQLLRLNWGIFSLHLVLTANFVALPIILGQLIPAESHWQLYLPVFVVAFMVMVPFIIVAEKKRRMKPVFLSAIGLLLIAELGLYFMRGSVTSIALFLLLFFTAFNLLEASLPSLVAKQSPTDRKGTAMGVYSSSQFLGIFVGGVLGGYLYGQWQAEGVFLFGAGALLLWWLFAFTMQAPRYLSSYVMNVGQVTPAEASSLATRIGAVAGVAEVTVIAEEESAYLKVNNEQLDYDALNEFSANRA